MRKSLEVRLREGLRLKILRLLICSEPRRLSSQILGLALRDLDMEQSSEVLLAELRWMERQALVGLEPLDGGGFKVALTERGDLCGRGVTEEPGVARPALD